MSALTFVLVLMSAGPVDTCEDRAALAFELAERFGEQHPDAAFEDTLAACEAGL